MTFKLLSAGYTGNRLCRTGTANLAEIVKFPQDIVYYACGWKFNIFYTQSHQWYGCGDNEYNQMGDSSPDKDTLTVLNHLKHIIPNHFACGDRFTAIVSEEGFLYTMGNDYGRMPTKKNLEHRVTFVACGSQSMIAIPDGPGIYFWENGKCQPSYECPTITFIDAAAGNQHFVALSSDNKVFTWGKKHACGQGSKFSSSIPKPVNIDNNPLIVRVFAYNNTTFLLDGENKLWVSGSNNRGQAGLGSNLRQTKVFLSVPTFTTSTISLISVGDAMSYVLTLEGEVFSTGDGDDSRLMQEKQDSLVSFTQCSLLSKKPVSFISCGCSHVIVALAMRNIMRHPILGLREATAQHMKEYEAISKNLSVDVSDYGFSCTGFKRKDIVEVDGMGDAIVEGITYTKELALRLISDKSIYLYGPKNGLSFPQLLPLKSREGSTLVEATGKCGFKYKFDATPSICSKYGFLYGEVVQHEQLGSGTIIGVLGGALWFSWVCDNGLVTRAKNTNPFQLHKMLTISQSERKITRKTIENDIINIEKYPCCFLESYGFQIKDIVSFNYGLYKIYGTFLHYVVLKKIGDGTLMLAIPTSLILQRRKALNSVFVTRRTINDKIVNVDVSFSESDKYIPLDRIITKIGFATIIGKAQDGLWIQYDDTLVLNAGITLITDIESSILIRRIGQEYSYDGLSVGMKTFSDNSVLPGDVICIDDENFTVLGINENQKHIIMDEKCIKQNINIYEVSFTIVYRAGIDFKRTDKTQRNLECQFDINLDRFKGCRMKAGDKVITPDGEAIVTGMLVSDIWFKHKKDTGSICYPPQAVYNPSLIKVVSRLGSGLIK